MLDFVIAKYNRFIKDFQLVQETEKTNWQRFVNYEFFSQFQPGRLDTDEELLDLICVDSDEFSEINGALFLLNDQILSNTQDVKDILDRDRNGLLEIYFLTFGDTSKFMKQVEKLLDKPSEVQKCEQWIDILSYSLSEEAILHWKSNPVINLIIYQKDKVAKKIDFDEAFRNRFSDAAIITIDKTRLESIIRSNENNYTDVLDSKGANFMIPGGSEKLGNALVASLYATDLVRLITTSDGLLRRNMFDDNVRDWQGYSTVNHEILNTLKNFPERFVLFNNGITIVCKKVTVENGKYKLENPQIVNGCQTCNMIYQAYRDGENLNGVQIIAKIVGSDEEVTQGIVRGANRQNIVYEEAFETIRPFHKNLERFFASNQVKGYQEIYYERRARQYAQDSGIKPNQKIAFRGLIQSMVALFLNHVEESHRHESTLLKNYKEVLFVDGHSCAPYYLAAFLYLNIEALFRDHKLPKALLGFKMHIMLLVKEMQGGPSPSLDADKIDQYCDHFFEVIEDGKLEKYAIEACEKFMLIREKWINIKGQQYQFGIKDSIEFRNFLMKEIYGTTRKTDVEKIYTGYVLNVNYDRTNRLFGFIEAAPQNIFFHEFDNPDMNRSYIGKKVSYRIARNGDRERAIEVKIIDAIN